MTPYEIDVLLHYSCRALDHPDVERNPPVWRPTIVGFLEERLLESVPADEMDAKYPATYRISERGRAYCDALQAVPLPRQQWVIDWPKENV